MKALPNMLFGDTSLLRLRYHKAKSFAARMYYGNPAKYLRVIGVTGTDGKTTTVAMISHILRASGKTVGASSSAFQEINGVRTSNPTQKTSLPPFALQKFLRSLAKKKCEFAVLEASSHGLLQGRLFGIRPEIAVMTNISMEHLDYHGTMEKYLKAKAILFDSLGGIGTKIINIDDESFKELSTIRSAKTLTFSPLGNAADLTVLSTQTTESGSKALLNRGSGPLELELAIPGTFNIFNAAAAILAAEAVGIPAEESVAMLKTFHGAPGRMERIETGLPFEVFVDFTVTPVAYRQTLSSLKHRVRPNGRLLVLTGSCGDRMKEKRPIIGKICGELADIVVVTNEDPYTEDPEKIIDEVFAGIPQDLPVIDPRKADKISGDHDGHSCFAVRISDRLSAIKFLLRHAKSGDVILFAGKGGDVTMTTNKGRIPWNESAIVRAEIDRLRQGA